MDRLISEQAVLEAFREYQGSISDFYKAIKAIPSADKWIPVSERLPEERKSVLVYAPEYNNIYCAYLDGDTWFIFGGYGSYAVANVTAWMPLPTPYEPQERSE